MTDAQSLVCRSSSWIAFDHCRSLQNSKSNISGTRRGGVLTAARQILEHVGSIEASSLSNKNESVVGV
jgi:hypothetical protein